jgi:hypothetical protein
LVEAILGFREPSAGEHSWGRILNPKKETVPPPMAGRSHR